MFLYLSETQSALVQLLLVLGSALLLSAVLNRKKPLHRSLLFLIGGLLSLRYLYWRATATLVPFSDGIDWFFSWAFFGFEAASVFSSLSAFAILSRTSDRSLEVQSNLAWWPPDQPPRVAVLIATYNEEREVLERTIIGAKASNHSNFDVIILDDGKRDWLRNFCELHAVRYFRRSENKGSKAGNLNNALAELGKEVRRPDFVAVLDADFVPHRDFLSRCLALFHDPSVGLVQTPQHFFNPDPIQHNLGLSRSYPDEQRFFFDHLQPSRDGWGIAFCCGTSSVTRWTALDAVGGLPTDSITEDFMLTLKLQDRGYRTVYLNEPLTEGLAPEGLKEYITQRARWCLGLMQIARSGLGPLARNNLRWRDRWSVADSLFYWLTTYPFRIAAMVFPLLYWYFNITVVDASIPQVIDYFGLYIFWVLFTLNFISGGLIVPIVNDVSQLLGAVPITRAAVTGLLRPKGHPFSVTAKGGDRSKVVVQWRLMGPFLALFIFTLVGLSIGIASDQFAFNDAGDGKQVVLFWSVYNLIVLGVALAVCVEIPRTERHFADSPERTLLYVNHVPRRVWVTELTQRSARVRGERLERNTVVEIAIRDVGLIAAKVSQLTEDGVILTFDVSSDQHESLLRRLYAEGQVPSVSAARLTSIIRDFFTRRH